jgi:F-type H+-transporting ATPase subunit b
MKPAERWGRREFAYSLGLGARAAVRLTAGLALLAWTTLPALAQEQSAPDPADSLTGTIFRWLNFALVMGVIIYLISKVGAPYFRQNAQAISQSIRQAAEERAAAEHELNEISQKLAKIDVEIQQMRRTAASESAAQAERIRTLARTEVERVAQAARAEIMASERAAALELRGAAARLATERAAALISARVSAAAEAGLFRSFILEVEKSAS